MPMRSGSLAIIVLLSATVRVLGVEDWKPVRLWTCGTEQDAWVIAESEPQGSSKLPVIQMWHGGAKPDPAALPIQKAALPPISGKIQNIAADTMALRVLFTDLSTGDYFPARIWAAGASWRQHSTQAPLAWGGDSGGAFVYAIVRNGALIPLTTAPAEPEDEKSKTVGKKKPANEPAAVAMVDPGGLTILVLHLGAWRRMPGPTAAETADNYWITGRDGHPGLFYRDGDDIFFVTHVSSWSEPQKVCSLKNLQTAWAGSGDSGPVWFAGVGESIESVNIHPYVKKGREWQDLDAIREGTELLAIDGRKCGVSLARGKIAIARPTEKDVEFGSGDLGPTSLIRFGTLSLRRPEPEIDQQWQDTIVLAILLGIMTLVMWTRRAEIASPVPIPEGLVLAPVWKRVIASGVDLIPAVLIVAPWWWPKLQTMREELSVLSGEQIAANVNAALQVEIYAVCFVHGLWCFCFEVIMASTPGKMLTGIRVLSTEGGRPNVRQCLIRNATRSIMISLRSSGLLVTLMTMIVVSRNRQRVGDLLARTIVVEPAPEIPEDTIPE